MCGRFTLTANQDILAKEFGLKPSLFKKWVSRYNITPSNTVPVLYETEETKFDLFRWGLIPSWAKEEKIGEGMINARSESLLEKPSFRELFRRQRCLIVADGFYEWKGDRKRKVPYYFRMRSKGPFAFAGLWSRWKSPSGSEVTSCSIITGEPNEVVASVHHRMPVILPRENYGSWLHPGNQNVDQLISFLKPYSGEAMEGFSVSDYVNSPGHDSPQCILPVQEGVPGGLY